ALQSPRFVAFDPAVQFNRSYPPCCRTADKILFVGPHKRRPHENVSTLGHFVSQTAVRCPEDYRKSLILDLTTQWMTTEVKT
ncbi:MAG: hypothetical protein MN733_03175, partial [Nitrososphaera sp.]|nr:hypothetical protein [Nitrososphaera sp.]